VQNIFIRAVFLSYLPRFYLERISARNKSELKFHDNVENGTVAIIVLVIGITRTESAKIEWQGSRKYHDAEFFMHRVFMSQSTIKSRVAVGSLIFTLSPDERTNENQRYKNCYAIAIVSWFISIKTLKCKRWKITIIIFINITSQFDRKREREREREIDLYVKFGKKRGKNE